MNFSEVKEIPNIARRSGCSVFVVPRDIEIEISGALKLAPEDRSTITIEQVREVIARLSVRQTSEIWILVRPAEAMSEEAANALLKNLEEPGEKVHFVLVTDAPSRLLPTILSRSAVYFWRVRGGIDADIVADAMVKDLAKRLIVAKPAEVVKIAEEITKKKDGTRMHALTVLEVAIEMLYKSYFRTEREVFLKKMPSFLAAYEAILRNGHVKLQLVANLV